MRPPTIASLACSFGSLGAELVDGRFAMNGVIAAALGQPRQNWLSTVADAASALAMLLAAIAVVLATTTVCSESTRWLVFTFAVAVLAACFSLIVV